MVHMNIGIGSDHRGFSYAQTIKLEPLIADITLTWHDFGCFSAERTDYPIYAHAVAHALQNKRIERGVLLCGSGVGMAMAANRHPGVYAAVIWNESVAQQARADDNINILVIPTDYVPPEKVPELLFVWLSTPFKQGRYAERLASIDTLCSK